MPTINDKVTPNYNTITRESNNKKIEDLIIQKF
jgi:hypothetical protein